MESEDFEVLEEVLVGMLHVNVEAELFENALFGLEELILGVDVVLLTEDQGNGEQSETG